MNDRIISIDVLRGFAVLGILIMNITSFAMPSMAYFSPVVYDPTLLNHIFYGFSHIIADQKFMAIFSMLFGASTILFIDSAIKKVKNHWILFYSRNFWLLIIGWLHSYYIWYGDVLFIYATCSFLLFFFKKITPKKQFVLGIIIYLIPTFSNYATFEYVIDHLPQTEQDVIIKHWNPPDEILKQELDAYRGPYKKQVRYRARMWASSDKKDDYSGGIGAGIIGLSFLIDLFSRSFGMMLIGMACFSWGIFSNSKNVSFYKKMIVYGFGIGLPLSMIGLYLTYFYDWNWKYIQFLGRIPNNIATPFIAFGYIGFIMLCTKNKYFKPLQARLEAIGKTALTSYIIQSVIATFIFYGIGLGLFGYLNRISQAMVMLLIWVFLLIVCPLWLRKFRYGPLEWIWRTLTYMRVIPLSK